jgi:SAM-dependent methyltransferase
MGIAQAVGPMGRVVGVDRDEGLLQFAVRSHARLPNLHFTRADAAALPFRDCFDIVTAARMVQWISDPGRAVRSLTGGVKPGGLLVVLDYDHRLNRWEPDPPPEFGAFYEAFLAWRESHGWDNRMAGHLPELFRAAGLEAVESHPQDEVAERGQAGFDEAAALWSRVMENAGGQAVREGFLREAQLREAGECYRGWAQSDLRTQRLAMRTVTGRRC